MFFSFVSMGYGNEIRNRINPKCGIILARFSYLKRWIGLHLRHYFEFDACDKNIIFKVSSNRMIDSN